MLSYDRVCWGEIFCLLNISSVHVTLLLSRDAIQLGTYISALLLWISPPFPILVRACPALHYNIYIRAYSRFY